MKLQLLKQNLNYDDIVQGKHLDLKTYNKKFKIWDYVVKNNLMGKENPDAIRLLNDDTIYAYAFFKNEDGTPFRYTAYQDAIANCHHDFSPTGLNRFILFLAANQIGKSKLLCGKAIKIVNTENNVNVVMVSKSLPQSQFLQAQIRHTLNNSAFSESWREDLGDTANKTILTFERNEGKIVNRIICCPCGEGLLGYPVNYLFLDELDFYEDAKTFFWKVALPRTNKTKGQIIGFSNPNPDISRSASILWELWNSDMFKRKFNFRFLDATWNTQAEYEMVKKESPSYIFSSTHDGEFPPDGGGFFSNEEIKRMMQKDWRNELPIVDRPVYLGVDLAKIKDSTVITLGILRKNKEDEKISDLEVKYLQALPTKIGYDVAVGRLKEIVDYYKKNFEGVARIGVDTTGVGEAVKDFARREGINVTDVKFSLQHKSKMFANFKLLAEQSRIRVAYNSECEKQLANLVFKRTPQGYLSVHHEKESQRDDYPDSICALIDVSIEPSRVPVTITRVESKPKEEQAEKMLSDLERREKAVKQSMKSNMPDYRKQNSMNRFGGLKW